MKAEEPDKNIITHPPIKCLFHQGSVLVDGNVNHVSIYQELCRVYNVVFALNMNFDYSHNTHDSNIIINDLPTIFYSNLIIRKDNIHSFLKQLVGLKEIDSIFDKNLSDEKRKIKTIEADILEKSILTELQLAINFFKYHHNFEKTNSIMKLIKIFYQPWKIYRTSSNDRIFVKEISKNLGITSKYEAMDFIKKINSKVENFLELMGGNKYIQFMGKRELNSLDLLFYASYKAQLSALQEKLEKYDLNKCPNYMKLVGSIDYMILNKFKSLNMIQIRQPTEIVLKNTNKEKLFKFTFGEYCQVANGDETEKRRGVIRRGIISGGFVFMLIILKIAFK